ncbi:MAG: flagellar basal-body rod protein FlgF [Thermoguttaceae bacterium]|nr:flagellar basal-body rod protein FlgF [Thermoguttaceae bacterium]MDW8038917.1 flagellar basal-body rod protein FlgF [Thermoguttaceae bacterium]
MPYGLYIAAEGAHAQAKRLEVIANNLANADTPGFKRQLAIFQARYAEAIEQGEDWPGSGSINQIGGGVMVRETPTDFAPGTLERTGLPTDVALEGEGFFWVEKGQERFLTRAGNFRLSSRGELVTQQGYFVLGEDGSPIVLPQPTRPFEINSAGQIVQGGFRRALAVVKPPSAEAVQRVGENLFHIQGQPEPVPSAQRRLLQGFLERSGVRPALELLELIETSRLIEANLNLMKAQDQMLSGLVHRLLKV